MKVKCSIWILTIHQEVMSISAFCSLFGEPSLIAPNSELRVHEEVVQGTFKGSLPSNPLQVTLKGRGKKKKRFFKFKRDLFESMILFQPEMSQEVKVITNQI